jgi:hypothetical protein
VNEIQVTIHKIGEINDALTGKPADGLVVSFGEFKQTALSWKSFKQLVGLRCPKAEAKPETKPAPAPTLPQPTPNGPVAAPK